MLLNLTESLVRLGQTQSTPLGKNSGKPQLRFRPDQVSTWSYKGLSHGLYHRLVPLVILGTFRSLRFMVGWPLKSCTHTGIFPSVSGPSAVKNKLRKVHILYTLPTESVFGVRMLHVLTVNQERSEPLCGECIL